MCFSFCFWLLNFLPHFRHLNFNYFTFAVVFWALLLFFEKFCTPYVFEAFVAA